MSVLLSSGASIGSDTPAINKSYSTVDIACILLFLCINPFLALFIMAVLSLQYRISLYVFVVSASISFTLFFFLREYGVDWYFNSTDDVPNYIWMYQSNYSLEFVDILKRFIELPTGNELLWHIPSWMLLNWFGASDETFVLLHYFLIFLTLFFAIGMISSRHFVALSLIYFFLTPISLDSVAHIWRQQIASSMFLGGMGLYFNRGARVGKLMLLCSALMHLSFLFYSAVFLAVESLRVKGKFQNKKKVVKYIIITMLFVPLLLYCTVYVLDSVGLPKILSYFEGYDIDALRVYLIIGIYAIPLLIAFFYFPMDAINTHIAILCLTVFSIVISMPFANSIYDRMLMFVLPLMALFFYRIVLFNITSRWRLPVLVIIFLLGINRLYAISEQGFGVGHFLANGHAFNPFMGGFLSLLTYLNI